jgi:thiamine-phosphate pyrophosphorylase
VIAPRTGGSMHVRVIAPRVVVITDRRRYASEEIAGRVAAIAAAVPRGTVAFQVREKDLDGGPLLRLAREVIEVARPAGAQVWINDRVDLALIAGADGVHLPEDGLPIADARAVAAAAGRVLALGASRHGETGALAAAAAGADLVQLGPIFATPSKQPLGTAPLGVRARLPPSTTLVAVGGIDSPERAREAVRAGADAVAVIRAAWTSADPGALVRALVEATQVQ